MRSKLILAAFLTAVLTPGAWGMIIDSSGNVTDWGLKPFTSPNGSDIPGTNRWSTIQNDYAPINYPGVGYQPSPGNNNGGEAVDLEELHVRVQDGLVQLLLVTSSAWSTQGRGNTFYLGDMFLTVGGQKYGIVTQTDSQGLAQGAIYRLDLDGDTQGIQQQPGSYYALTTLVDNDYGPKATVSQVVGPWAVSGSIAPGQLIGMAGVSAATFNYGGREDGTFLVEYSFDSTLLGLLEPANLTAQVTWGCGNDVIRTQGATVPVVPEPVTLLLMAVGGTFVFLTSRRQRPVR
jgi:hypothetical protein